MLSENERACLRGEISRELAIHLTTTGWWKDMLPHEVAVVQLGQSRLCMDWEDFKEAVSSALGRPVFTHEFGWPAALLEELNGQKTEPSLDEIIGLLPGSTVVLVEDPGRADHS